MTVITDVPAATGFNVIVPLLMLAVATDVVPLLTLGVASLPGHVATNVLLFGYVVLPEPLVTTALPSFMTTLPVVELTVHVNSPVLSL